jgi:hypothetical protein
MDFLRRRRGRRRSFTEDSADKLGVFGEALLVLFRGRPLASLAALGQFLLQKLSQQRQTFRSSCVAQKFLDPRPLARVPCPAETGAHGIHPPQGRQWKQRVG